MLPKELRIIGKTYKVVVVPGMTEYGLCCEASQTIRLQPGVAHELARDTLLHECVHAIDFNMHIGLTEEQVQRLGSGLFALLKENPALASYILENPPKPKRTRVTER